jgi:hypothetical protein
VRELTVKTPCIADDEQRLYGSGLASVQKMCALLISAAGCGEEMVQETFLKSGWETALVAIPFIGLLFFAVFGLDAVIGRSKKKDRRRRPASGQDEDGMGYYTDPDGRRWKERRKAKRPE